MRRAVPWLLLGSLVPAVLSVADSLLGFPWSGTFPNLNFAFSFGLPAAGQLCIAAGLWQLGSWPTRTAAVLGVLLALLGVLFGASMTNLMQRTASLGPAGDAVFWLWSFTPLLLGAFFAWRQGHPRWPWLVFALSPLWLGLLLFLPALAGWNLPVASPEDVGDLELWLSLTLLPWAVLAWALWQTSRPSRQNIRHGMQA